MSGRNSRIVRNRDRSDHFFNFDSNNAKIIVSIVAIILIIVLTIIVILVKFNHFKKANKINFAKNTDISYEYFILYSGENVGVIDKTGKIIIEPKYSQITIPNPEKDVFVCQDEDDKYEILNKNKKNILKDFENISIIEGNEDIKIKDNLLKYEKNGKYGLVDLDGKQISDAIYEKISKLKDNPNTILVKKDGKYGILDLQGNIFLEPVYDKISADEYCSEKDLYVKTGFIISEKTKDGVNYGYIDYKGNKILDTKYESIERAFVYDEDNIYLIAMQNGKKGVFKNKKKIIDLNFQNIYYSNIFVVNKNGKYGFYNREGKVILKPKYKEYSIAGNYISVADGDETKLYDINGNLVNNNGYIKMIETNNPSYFIAENIDNTYSIISKDVTINENYSQITYAFDDYFIVSDKDGKTGVIDASSNEIKIDLIYDYILNINGTSVLEAIDGMKNTIDIYSNNLEKTLSMENGILNILENGYSVVYSEVDMKYINSNGEIVENTEVYPNKKLYSICKNGKWGYSDPTGKNVIECEYDIATEFNEYGFASIKKGEKWGVVSENGKIIIEPTYELDTYYFPQFIGKYLLTQSENIYCQEIL